MPPKVDLTDNVKFCMMQPDTADDMPLRKALRERRREEVRVLYNTRAVPIKEQRDPARGVLHNVYHQELEKKTEVPVVYKLLAGQYSRDAETMEVVPAAVRAQRAADEAKKAASVRPATASQTLLGTAEPIATPPQRVDPKMEDILAASRHVKPKSNVTVVDRGTGREVKSIGVGANPSDIVKATMHRTSRPLSASATVPRSTWQPTRTLQTHTILTGSQWNADLTEVPKMGTTTLLLRKQEIPDALKPVPARSGSRSAHRPRDTMFIF